MYLQTLPMPGAEVKPVSEGIHKSVLDLCDYCWYKCKFHWIYGAISLECSFQPIHKSPGRPAPEDPRDCYRLM